MGRIDMGSLADLKALLHQHGLAPCRAKGQNFLFPESIQRRIVQQIGAVPPMILEIGPGLGGLTQALRAEYPDSSLILMEKDVRFAEILAQRIPNSTLILGDALALDWMPYEGATLIGNLPYNVSVPLVLRYVRHADLFPQAIFMFQREVGQRIMALPKSKAYGRLSVMIQAYTKVSKVMDLPSSVFWPKPAVDSMLLQFHRLDPMNTLAFSDLEPVVAAAFQHRRKMMTYGLASLGIPLEEAPFQLRVRAEEVSVPEFIRLAQWVKTVR
jgi:16S rRNA (adenine1518-N6/adenine1519-N6)-dimethyltransferase